MVIAQAFDLSAYLAGDDVTCKPENPNRFTDGVIDLFYQTENDTNPTLPWDKTHDLFRFRPGETTVWCGINGHGKSLLTSQVMLDLAMRQQEKVSVLSLEMSPERTLYRMVRQACGNSQPTIRYIKCLLEEMTGKVTIIPQLGTVKDQKDVIAVTRYAHKNMGTKHMFIDSLMKCVKSEDDYNQQKSFVDELVAVGKDTGVHIHLIHHVRKTQDEFAVPGKFDSRGSASITDQVDNFIVVWRNKKKEMAMAKPNPDEKTIEQADAALVVYKQRNGEWEGRVNLWFDPAAMSYVARRGLRANPYDIDLNAVVEVQQKPEREFVDNW